MPIIHQSQNLPTNGVPIYIGLQLVTNALMAHNSRGTKGSSAANQ